MAGRCGGRAGQLVWGRQRGAGMAASVCGVGEYQRTAAAAVVWAGGWGDTGFFMVC